MEIMSSHGEGEQAGNDRCSAAHVVNVIMWHSQITGGRNGYGAKLANIFSVEFTVETCDGKRQRRFLQTFTNNMSSKTVPKITACKPSDNWTCITFQPDLAKFDMQVSSDRQGMLVAHHDWTIPGGGCSCCWQHHMLAVWATHIASKNWHSHWGNHCNAPTGHHDKMIHASFGRAGPGG
jgi:hypothetical protein